MQLIIAPLCWFLVQEVIAIPIAIEPLKLPDRPPHVKTLTRFTNLDYLSLSDTKVTDARLEHLKKLTSLQRLAIDDRNEGQGAGVVGSLFQERRPKRF